MTQSTQSTQIGTIKDLKSCLKWMIQKIKLDRIEGIFGDWLEKEEDEAVTSIHFTSGMALRNELKLWGENTFSKWFNSQGIKHADDTIEAVGIKDLYIIHNN